MATSPPIFVSHSSRDSVWCRQFVKALRAYGADVWYDELHLGAGPLRISIEREILLRPVFITVLSPTSARSKWVARETDAAILLQDRDDTRTILFVVAAKCDVPLLWTSYKRLTGPDDGALLPQDAALATARILRLTFTTDTQSEPADDPIQNDANRPETDRSGRPAVLSLAAVTSSLPRAAVTDLYDSQRRMPTFHIPWLLAVIILLGGVVAIVASSLNGYVNLPLPPAGYIHSFAAQPWPLYLWLSFMLIAFEWVILRHPSLRTVRARVIGVSLVSALIVCFVVFYGPEISGFIRAVVPPDLGFQYWGIRSNPFTYTALDVGLILLYWMYAMSLWIRLARGFPVRLPAEREPGERAERGAARSPSSSQGQPTMTQLVASTCIGAAVVSCILALQFNTNSPLDSIEATFGPFYPFAFQDNELAIPGVNYHAGIISSAAPSLYQFNLALAAVFLVMAALITGIAIAGELRIRSVGVVARNRSPGQAVLTAVRAVFDIHILTFNARRLLQEALWPLLLVGAQFAIAVCTWRVVVRFHLIADLLACPTGIPCARLQVMDLYAFGLFLTTYENVRLVVYILLSALGAVVCVAAGIALLLNRTRVLTNSLRFIRQLAWHVLLTYWVCGAVLATVNIVLVLARVTDVQPFQLLDWPTVGSFILAGLYAPPTIWQTVGRFYAAGGS